MNQPIRIDDANAKFAVAAFAAAAVVSCAGGGILPFAAAAGGVYLSARFRQGLAQAGRRRKPRRSRR